MVITTMEAGQGNECIDRYMVDGKEVHRTSYLVRFYSPEGAGGEVWAETAARDASEEAPGQDEPEEPRASTGASRR